MNYKQIVDLAYNIIDEVDYDEQIEIIIKEAINEAYLDLSKVDKRIDIAYVPIIRKMATLPENCIDIEECTPPLGGKDRIVGNVVITEKTGVLEMMYSTSREILVNDEDIPDLHITLHHDLAIFACYRYFLHRKKPQISDQFLNKYLMEKSEFEKMMNEMSSAMMDAVVIDY